jgi:hypothetical protein
MIDLMDQRVFNAATSPALEPNDLDPSWKARAATRDRLGQTMIAETLPALS